MSTLIECPVCTKRYKVKAELLKGGRRVKCPHCSHKWWVTADDAADTGSDVASAGWPGEAAAGMAAARGFAVESPPLGPDGEAGEAASQEDGLPHAWDDEQAAAYGAPPEAGQAFEPAEPQPVDSTAEEAEHLFPQAQHEDFAWPESPPEETPAEEHRLEAAEAADDHPVAEEAHAWTDGEETSEALSQAVTAEEADPVHAAEGFADDDDHADQQGADHAQDDDTGDTPHQHDWSTIDWTRQSAAGEASEAAEDDDLRSYGQGTDPYTDAEGFGPYGQDRRDQARAYDDTAFADTDYQQQVVPPFGGSLDSEAAAIQAQLEEALRPHPLEDRPLGGLALAAAWGIFVCLAAGALGAAVGFRQGIAEVLPGARQLYATIGLPVIAGPVELDNVSYHWVLSEGRPMIEVTGEIVNTTDGAARVPPLFVTVHDEGGGDPIQVVTDVRKAPLAAGERANFSLEFLSPPAAVSRIELAFGTAAQ